MNNSNAYRMTDTIFECNSLKLNFNLNLLWILPETEMYEERTLHYWSDYRVKNRSKNSNLLIKRKLDYFMTFEIKDYRRGIEDSIFIPNDHLFKFVDSINYAYEMLFGKAQQSFIKENGMLKINNSLPVVSDTYPKNKVFRIAPIILNVHSYQQAGAILSVGSVDNTSEMTDVEFGYLAYMLRNFNAPMYAASMMAALGPLDDGRGDFATPTLKSGEAISNQHAKLVKGRTFASKSKNNIM